MTGSTQTLVVSPHGHAPAPVRRSYGLTAMAMSALALVAHSALHIDNLAAADLAFAVGLVVMVAFIPADPLRWLAAFLAPGLALLASVHVAVAANRPEPHLQSGVWFLLWLAGVGLLMASAARGRLRSAARRLMRAHTMEVAQVTVLVAFALLLRVFNPTGFPAPVQTDEVDYIISALGVQRHGVNLFASGFFGVPNLWIAGLSGFERVFSDPVFAGRLYSGLIGTAAIPLLYGFLREGFDRRAATGGAIFLALSFAHLQYSRMALPNATDTTIAVAAWWCCIRALRTKERRDWLLLGVVLGLGAFGWISARLVLLEVLMTLAWALVVGRIALRQLALGVTFTGLTAVAVVLPLATWWIGHPNEFKGRLRAVGITQEVDNKPSWLQSQHDSGHSYLSIFASQTDNSVQAVFGGPERTQFLASDKGMFDLVATALIVLGAIVARTRIREPACFLALMSVVLAILFGGILTIPVPSSARLIAVVPGACALAAIGASFLVDAAPRASRFATVPVVCALVAMPGLFHYTTHQDGYRRMQGSDPLPGFADVLVLARKGDTVVWVTAAGGPPPFRPELNLALRDVGFILIDGAGSVIQKRPPIGDTRVGQRMVLLVPTGVPAIPYCSGSSLLKPGIELGHDFDVDAYAADSRNCVPMLASPQ